MTFETTPGLVFAKLPTNPRFVDLTGRVFSRLTVLGYAGKRDKTHFWNVQCLCGEIRVVRGGRLVSHGTKSCGCVQKEAVSFANKTHGKTHSRVYNIWVSMLERCQNSNNPAFHRYGGRGIVVCESWQKFENFYVDMGDPPEGMSLDRRENNGNYEKSNCRWASLKTQSRNRRSSRILTIDGVSKCIADWADEPGAASADNISSRLRYGWSDREAVFGRDYLRGK